MLSHTSPGSLDLERITSSRSQKSRSSYKHRARGFFAPCLVFYFKMKITYDEQKFRAFLFRVSSYTALENIYHQGDLQNFRTLLHTALKNEMYQCTRCYFLMLRGACFSQSPFRVAQ